MLGEGKTAAHLGEKHRENSQADPVDNAGELECIINCRNKSTRSGYFLTLSSENRY